jgi:DNA-binding response OmpR family regulator
MHNLGHPKKLVVIVDDEEPVRRLLGSFLKMNGFRVLLAGTGNEALRICAHFRRRIDLMITDIQMPELSGFDLAGRMASLRPGMPVLFISGAFTEGDPEVRERLSPARDFLSKPFTQKSLSSKVETMLAASNEFSSPTPAQRSNRNHCVPV